MKGYEVDFCKDMHRVANALEDIAKELKKHGVRTFDEMTVAVLNNMKNKVEESMPLGSDDPTKDY